MSMGDLNPLEVQEDGAGQSNEGDGHHKELQGQRSGTQEVADKVLGNPRN